MTENSSQTAISTRKTSIGRHVNLLTTHMNAEMNTRLKSLGLSINSFAIFMTLFGKEGASQKELGKNSSMQAYNITRAIDALENSGLVERRLDPNSRRAHQIFLTPKGHALGPQVFLIITEVNSWLLSDLDHDEKTAFEQTLFKITTRLLHKNKKGSK